MAPPYFTMEFNVLSEFMWILLVLNTVCSGPPPPVQNVTVITLYTQQVTWNEADILCKSFGGKLLDISYYSMYRFLLSKPALQENGPWETFAVNGDPAWISMHRRITPIGDHFYNEQCQSLEEFNIADWRSGGDDLPDGDPDSMCVSHRIREEPDNNWFNDYTMDNCSEPRHFYCQEEQGPCSFEEVPGYYGYTSNDFTNNDITLSFTSVRACADYCLNVSLLYEFMGPPRLDVIEECWGFSVYGSTCKIHQIIGPLHFDLYKSSFSSSTLYIKRCFEVALNETTFSPVVEDLAEEPNSTCGIPVTGNSTAPPTKPVFVHTGSLTWNDAFTVCEEAGHYLLNVESKDTYLRLEAFLPDYISLGILSEGTIWLGIHEPNPQNKPNVWVWSDCAGVNSTDWGTDAVPSLVVYDTNLCAVLNTSTMSWKPAMCNETHNFVCVGEAVSEWVYDSGTNSTLGAGTTLGPYNVTSGECQDMCSAWTYEEEECWAYAFLDNNTGETFCRLYFAPDEAYYQTSIETVSNPYTFYRKKMWNDILTNTTLPTVANDSIFPYSCCDVSDMSATSACPSSIVPETDTNIPTTTGFEYVLYPSPATWNEANIQCLNSGGRLFELDTVAKRHAIEYFLSSWTQSGDLVGPIWSGLIKSDAEDECSLRWENDCSSPSWLAMDPPTSNYSYCAVYKDMSTFEMRECNDSYQYICQRETGACTMSEVANDRYCVIGSYTTVSPTACYDDCLRTTYYGKECWAVMEVNSICALLFYTDPMDCKEQYYYQRRQDVTFKSCFTSSVNNTAVDTVNYTSSGITPKTDCTVPFRYPFQRNSSVCRKQSAHSSVVSPSSIAPPESTMVASTSSLQAQTSIPSTVASQDITSVTVISASLTSPITIPESTMVASTSSLQAQTSILSTIASQDTTSVTVINTSPLSITAPGSTVVASTSSLQAQTPIPSTAASQDTTSVTVINTSPLSIATHESTIVASTSSLQAQTSFPSTFSSQDITSVTVISASPPISTTTPESTIVASTSSLQTQMSIPPTVASQDTTSVTVISVSPTSSITTPDSTMVASTKSLQVQTSIPSTSVSQDTTSVIVINTSSLSITTLESTIVASTSSLQAHTLIPLTVASQDTTSVTVINTSPSPITASESTIVISTSSLPESTSTLPTSSIHVFTSSVPSTISVPTATSVTTVNTLQPAIAPSETTVGISTTSIAETSLSPSTIQSSEVTSIESTSIGYYSTDKTTYILSSSVLVTNSDTIPILPSTSSLLVTSFTLSESSLNDLTSTSSLTVPVSVVYTSRFFSTSHSIIESTTAASINSSTVPVSSLSSDILASNTDYSSVLNSSSYITTIFASSTVTPMTSTTSPPFSSTIYPLTSTASVVQTSPAGTSPSTSNLTPTISPSTSSVVPYNMSAIYLWPCLCNPFPLSNLTIAEWNAWFVLTNTADKRSLSKFRRAHTSAEDNRPSAISTGAVGIGVLTVGLFVMVAADISTLLSTFVWTSAKYQAG